MICFVIDLKIIFFAKRDCSMRFLNFGFFLELMLKTYKNHNACKGKVSKYGFIKGSFCEFLDPTYMLKMFQLSTKFDYTNNIRLDNPVGAIDSGKKQS